MPLYYQQPYTLAQPPPMGLNDNTPVYYIPFTCEIITKDYLEKIKLYRQKVWTCTATGKTNLTYKEAAELELKAKHLVEERFPNIWKQPAIEIIHHSRLTLNLLVDHVYDFFRANRYVGELVFIDASVNGGESNVERAFIREKLDPETPTTLERRADRRQQMRDAKEEELLAEDSYFEDKFKYKVQLLNAPSQFYIVEGSQMRRPRQCLSKVTIKKFIRECASKDKWSNVWVCKPELVQKYNLPTEVPLDVKDFLDKRGDELAPGRRKKGVVFPTEDTDLLKEPLLRKPEEGVTLVSRPSLQHGFGEVSNSHVLTLFKVYAFVYTYSFPLGIYPFSLDDFVKALSHHEPHHPKTDIMAEVFGNIMALVCREWYARYDPTLNFHPCLAPLPLLDEENGYYHPDEKIHKDIDYFLNEYDSLQETDRLAADGWYKWHPGRYSGIPRKRVRTLQFNKKLKSTSSTDERMIAWSVAVFGFVKDWFVDLNDDPIKWRCLATLLDPVADLDGVKAEQVSEDPESETNDAVKEETKEEVKEDIKEEEELKEEEVEDVKMEDVQEPVPDEDNDQDYSFADDSMHVDQKESEIDELEEEEDELEDDEEVGPKTRSGRTRKRVADSEEDELEDDEEIMPSRSSRMTARVLQKETSKKEEKTPTKQPTKNIPVLDFETLVRRTERGFWKLSADDRLDILDYMLECCVIDSERFRSFREHALEDMMELFKEKREIQKQRKDIFDYLKANGVESGQEMAAQNSDSDDEVIVAHLSRAQKIKLENEKKERKKKKDDVAQLALNFQDISAAQEQDTQLYRRERVIDHELRIKHGICRIKSLGRDRYWNKYWWFDGGLSAYPFDLVTKGIEIKLRPGQKQPHEGTVRPWATGRILVEDFGLEEREKEGKADELFKINVIQGEVEAKYGFYSNPDEVEQLQQWLDTRGLRELSLQSNLDRNLELIIGGMEQRIQDLEEERQTVEKYLSQKGKRGRPSLKDHRESYISYSNLWA